MTEERLGLLILGLGNVLCADDGLGVAAVEELTRTYHVPPGVRVLDGGTLGLALLSWVAQADAVLLVDAVRGDEAPGTLVRLDGEEVAPAVRDRLSVHQVGVADLLDGLRLLDQLPPRLALVGLVPASLELDYGLSPAVVHQLPRLVCAVAEEAAALGFPLVRQHASAARTDAPGRRVVLGL
jgi:hydrogenase maturation protease